MAGFFPKIVGWSSNRTDVPVFQRDELIYTATNGFKSMLDLGDAWGYPALDPRNNAPALTPIAVNTALRNYAFPGTPAIVLGTPAYAGGSLVLSGVSTKVALGAEWRLPSTTTRFVIGWWGKIPMTGYPTTGSAGTGVAGLFGWANTNGSSSQWAVRLDYDLVTGNFKEARIVANGVNETVTPFIPSDGLPHFYAFEVAKLTDTTYQVKFYVDGNLVYTGPARTWSGALIVPTSGSPVIGQYVPAYSDARGTIGRMWLCDLTALPTIAANDIIAADFAQNVGRFA